jgi:hypothetical protein
MASREQRTFVYLVMYGPDELHASCHCAFDSWETAVEQCVIRNANQSSSVSWRHFVQKVECNPPKVEKWPNPLKTQTV